MDLRVDLGGIPHLRKTSEMWGTRPSLGNPNFALDLLFLFSYIDGYAHSAFPQMLRRLLQEMRPRRVKWNGRLPCQLDPRGVLDVRREAAISAF